MVCRMQAWLWSYCEMFGFCKIRKEALTYSEPGTL